MDPPSQDRSLTTGGRSNQKLRTRAALLRAAADLVREGAEPSIPDAAERALVSVATAYRYFSSAEALWWEATEVAFESEAIVADATRQAAEAGPDVQTRLRALATSMGYRMLDDQVPYRRFVKHAIEHSLDPNRSTDDGPVRQGRRTAMIDTVLAPLRTTLPDQDIERIAHALGMVVGAEIVLSLIDALNLDTDTAKQTLLDANRWLLAGALTELTPDQTTPPTHQP